MQFFSYLLVFGTLFVFCKTVIAEIGIYNWTSSVSKCEGKERVNTFLDVSRDLINKAKNLYLDGVEGDQILGQKETSLALLDVAMNMISEVKKGYPTCNITNHMKCPDTECPKPVLPKPLDMPVDCSDILRSGKKESGVYIIWPRSRITTNKSVTVYCDMDTDGGGWTVIQRRGEYSTPKDYFYKDWESYKNGFGNLTEEFWLGNDNIFAISNQAMNTIRFDMKDDEGKTGYAEYNTFWIEEENANYTLHIEGYEGNAGDAMYVSNKMMFSTKDRNNDKWIYGDSCAVEYKSGWWHKDCVFANLNGPYQPGIESPTGFFWFQWTNKRMGLSAVEMKLRS